MNIGPRIRCSSGSGRAGLTALSRSFRSLFDSPTENHAYLTSGQAEITLGLRPIGRTAEYATSLFCGSDGRGFKSRHSPSPVRLADPASQPLALLRLSAGPPLDLYTDQPEIWCPVWGRGGVVRASSLPGLSQRLHRRQVGSDTAYGLVHFCEGTPGAPRWAPLVPRSGQGWGCPTLARQIPRDKRARTASSFLGGPSSARQGSSRCSWRARATVRPPSPVAYEGRANGPRLQPPVPLQESVHASPSAEALPATARRRSRATRTPAPGRRQARQTGARRVLQP